MTRSRTGVLRRLRSEERGSLTVEFVVWLPILLLWLVASLAFFDGFRDRGRAQKAAQVIGDIVSRQVEMSDDLVGDLDALLGDLLPGTPDGKALRVTSVQFRDGVHEVQWSKATGPLTPLIAAQLPLEDLPVMGELETLVVVETVVPFAPMLGWPGITAGEWSSFVPSRPRFVPAIAFVD